MLLPIQELPHEPFILKVPMKILKSLQDGLQLRVKAEERLKAGNPPPTRGAPTGTQSLALLHHLASSPASAGDALKLLHELQVHQVELDLQHEHAEEDREQLALTIQSCTRLFDAAPFGYLTLEPDGKVIAANHIAAAWLGVESEQSVGRLIEDLVHAEDRLAIHELLRSLRDDSGRQKCLLRSKIHSDAVQAVISATSAAIDAPVLLAFMPAD
jgi:PAS domain-containing protein